MKRSNIACIVVLAAQLVSFGAQAAGFFAPYFPNHWDVRRQSTLEFTEQAMEILKARIALARERIAGTKPELEALASQLTEIGNRMQAQGRVNTAAFYENAAQVVKHLPERFLLSQWLNEVEQEQIRLLHVSRQLVLPESGLNPAQGHAIAEARQRMYEGWLQFVKNKSGATAWFFEPQFLETQEAFNQFLLKSALPLCNIGQQMPAGLNLVNVDDGTAHFLHRGLQDYFLNYSFLFASISPQWPLQGDPASATLLEFQQGELNQTQLRISHSTPYFNLFHDSDVIAAMLDGKSGSPLIVSLTYMPWYRLLSSLAPRYDLKRHQLYTYYGAFKGDWGTTRWEPATSDFSCARELQNALVPTRPWNRRKTEGEMLAEALRAPK